MAQRAVARAVWRQGRRLAGRLIANATAGEQHLALAGLEVKLRNAAAFEAEALGCNEARAERALQRASSEGVGRHLCGGR
eukprot:6896309-Pyramimonas_sp.AAC.1